MFDVARDARWNGDYGSRVRMLLRELHCKQSAGFQGTDLAANTILALPIFWGMALQNQEGIIIQLM
jgi:hypothetical protein